MDYASQLRVDNLRTRDVYAYTRLHLWVNRQLGKANHCSVDETHKSTRYHWGNISGEYKKDFTDWRQLCPSCNTKESITDNYRELHRLNAVGNQSHAQPILMIYPNGSWIKFSSARKAQEQTGISYNSK